jgi:hypothetical protein
MSDDFTRRNSADQDKKLDADSLTVASLKVYRQRVVSPPMAIKLDQVSSTELYIGEALPGTATSSATWRIKKWTGTAMLFADGNGDYDNVWDDRIGLSYS